MKIPARSALIVIDVQNDYCHTDGYFAKLGKNVSMIQAMLPQLVSTIDYFREKAIPLIFIRTIHEEWSNSIQWKNREIVKDNHDTLSRRDSFGSQFYKVEPRDGEPVITKHRYSAFYGTNLEIVLRSLQTEKIILSGVLTNVCVESTARDACMRDFEVITLQDCTATITAAEQEASIRNISSYFGTVATSADYY